MEEKYVSANYNNMTLSHQLVFTTLQHVGYSNICEYIVFLAKLTRFPTGPV